MKIYLINYVNSAGLDGGRETLPHVAPEPEPVINLAYDRYKKEFVEAKSDKLLDDMTENPLTYDEFKEEMEYGFKGWLNTVYLNLVSSHIQFEAFSFDTGQTE